MASPAEPILASVLWSTYISNEDSASASNSSKAATDFPDLDRILDGGFSYGNISCLSSEAESSAGDISLGALVTHVLAAPTHVATVVDSTLSFDIRNLLRRLKAALVRVAAVSDDNERLDVDKLAMAALERVQIMQIFDFEGLVECLGELRETLEKENASAALPKSTPTVWKPRGTVADSEDEDDEMLDGAPSPRAAPINRTESLADPAGKASTPQQKRSMILINNIAQVAAPLIKRDPTRGQALLISFLRSLQHFTRTHSLLTLIVNLAAVAYTGSAASKESTPSCFASCELRPALGKSFAYMLDLHMLVHAMPRTREGARAVYSGGQGRVREGEMVDVVEVLHDRFAGRVGRWAICPLSGAE